MVALELAHEKTPSSTSAFNFSHLPSNRRTLIRWVPCFAAVPLAVSLIVWPVRVAVFGEDAFRSGGTDAGAANGIFEVLEIGFLV